jgi:hypothetical protein
MHSATLLALSAFAVQALTASIGSQLHKRDCEALPLGPGTVPTPDTAEAFSTSPEYASIAQAAATPSGYSKAYGPKTSTSNVPGYMGTDLLETYDPSICATACAAKSGCVGFDICKSAPSQPICPCSEYKMHRTRETPRRSVLGKLSCRRLSRQCSLSLLCSYLISTYLVPHRAIRPRQKLDMNHDTSSHTRPPVFERAPTQNPAATCPNPPSTTLIKCNYWGSPLSEATATNDGQWRNDFHVLVSGVNGYNKAASTTPVSDPQCADRSIRLCCMNVAPWSTNSYVWGGICGYTPADPSELVGARCIPRPASGKLRCLS